MEILGFDFVVVGSSRETAGSSCSDLDNNWTVAYATVAVADLSADPEIKQL